MTIHSERCIRQVSPLATCGKCEAICPQRALSAQDGNWQVAQDLCTNCGLCITVCPNQVFQLEEQFLQQQSLLNEHLQICCYQAALPQSNILKINCLQQLYPELVIQLLNNVEKLTLYFDKNQCQDCVNGWYPPGLLLQLQQFPLPLEKLFLAEQNAQPTETSADKHSANTGRRSFLVDCLEKARYTSQKMIAQSVDQLLSLSTDEQTESALPLPKINLLSHRQGLFDCLLKAKETIDEQHILPYRQLHIDQCTFCGACAKLCPTGALTLHHDDPVKTLYYQSNLCLGCNLCIDLCLQKQIYWSDRLTTAQFMLSEPTPLIQGQKRICVQCDQPYWDAPEISDTCHFCHQV